jgi:hypothetical protein
VDPVHFKRARNVDRRKPAMRHRAAENRGMQHAGNCEVVDVPAAPAEQAQVFDTLDRRAHGVPDRRRT